MEIETEKAIDILLHWGWGYSDGDIAAAVHAAKDALLEKEKYKAAQEREKPVKVKADRVWNTFKCPNCKQIYGDDEHDVQTLSYCPHCGRPLEWET